MPTYVGRDTRNIYISPTYSSRPPVGVGSGCLCLVGISCNMNYMNTVSRFSSEGSQVGPDGIRSEWDQSVKREEGGGVRHAVCNSGSS